MLLKQEKQIRVSTVHQLVCAVDYIITDFNWKHCIGALSVDIAKAFDKDWHAGLVWKLNQQGVSEYLASPINSYLQGRIFRVRAGGVLPPLYDLNVRDATWYLWH